jgi:hypothetical protein
MFTGANLLGVPLKDILVDWGIMQKAKIIITTTYKFVEKVLGKVHAEGDGAHDLLV